MRSNCLRSWLVLYTLLHNRECKLPEIQQLRSLLANIDAIVSAAYGWHLDLQHDFHPYKQGTRFTISPQARAKVLDFLLALNHERYAAEQQDAANKKKKGKRSKSEEAPLLAML